MAVRADDAERRPWPVGRIEADVRRLGVVPGDIVMVHASLRAVGPVEGGADAVVDALDAAVGPGGTVVMTISARDDWAWVNERPEAEREALLLGGAEPFDRLRTPADPDFGVLAEVFRRRRGTVVGDHPEGRFGARGRGAPALVEDGPWDDYNGPGSPLARLVEGGGKVLRLGADPGTLTVIHYAEYLADLPAKRRVRRHRLVAGPGGPRVVVVSGLDDERGIGEVDPGDPWAGQDYFGVILRQYLATGRAATGTVGHAPSELIDAADVVRFAAAWMEEHLRC